MYQLFINDSYFHQLDCSPILGYVDGNSTCGITNEFYSIGYFCTFYYWTWFLLLVCGLSSLQKHQRQPRTSFTVPELKFLNTNHFW